MPTTLTTVPPDAIRSLVDLPGLGAGNFLPVAIAVSPVPEEPILWLEKPYRPFFGGSVDALSLASLKRAADAYAAWYASVGVRAKDPVGIYLDDGVEYLVHYVALTSLGAIPVLTNGNLAADIAAIYFQRVGVVGLFLDENHERALSPHLAATAPAGGYRFVATDDAIRGAKPAPLPAGFEVVHQPLDPIMIAHSSGTTGVPKAVVLQHEPFFHGVHYRLKFSSTGGAERILSALPHSHNCAMAYLMLALLCGNQAFVSSDHTGSNVAARIDAFQPTMVVAFPQTFVELTEQPLERFDFSSVRFWFNGGDAAHEQHIRTLTSLGSRSTAAGTVPGSLFVDGMGSSEMGFSLFRNVHGAGPSVFDRCVGTTIEWAEAAVIGDEGALLPAGVVGRLGVRAPSVTRGYWNDSVLTYRSQVAGFWLTGDLAYHDGEGRYFHVDRTPDLVRTASGLLYSLRTEERLLKTFAALADCSVIAAPMPDGTEGGILLARVRNDAWANESALLADANRALEEAGWPLLSAALIVEPADIPLGTTGKVLKRLLRERYRTFFASHGQRTSPTARPRASSVEQAGEQAV